ncbi:MAG: hypothetical protein Q8Q49_05055 [bacterium]|nr:hypothetical protein [bacterium]
MNNELKTLKRIYINQTVPNETVEELWQQLAPRLPEKQYHPYHYVTRYAFMTLCAVFVTLGGVVGVAQATKPNEPLYPVKVLTDRVVAKTTGIYHAMTKQKTTEPVTQKNNTLLNNSQEPTATMTQTQDREDTEKKTSHPSNENSSKTQEKENEKEEQITPANTTNQNNNNQSPQEVPEKAKEEVKGAQSNKQNDNPSEENKQSAGSNENRNQNINAENQGDNQNRGNSEEKHG